MFKFKKSASTSDISSFSRWQLLPDSLILHIFSFLESFELLRCAQCCKSWHRVSHDQFLWKKLFYNDWKISKSIAQKAGKYSWMEEYKRLKYHTPMIETEILNDHTDQVLHVSFSHSGDLFATSSKDGFIKIWNSEYPASLRYTADMKEYGWKYTQFSQFNESDTLLLVSGVHSGLHSTTGEIAVFSIDDEFEYQSKVVNKPYDIFGTWYNDMYLLSGQLLWLGHMVSSSVLWLNYAYQDTETPDKAVVTKLFKFYNKNASSVRTIIVANCGPHEEKVDEDDPMIMESVSHVRGNPVSHYYLNCEAHRASSVDARTENSARSKFSKSKRLRRITDPDNLSDLGRSILLESNWEDDDSDVEDVDYALSDPISSSSTSMPAFFAANPDVVVASQSRKRNPQEGDCSVLDPREKYLIFTTGSKTYTPHQIGFKKIKPFMFRDKINLNLNDRLMEQQERLINQSNDQPDYEDETSVQHMFDKVDHLIDLHGHIIGMALSPDHRYLYVNNRPWPKDYVIENPMKPPPIAQEIDIRVIDLRTLQEVGFMLRSHKAYTPNDECFFIFLDVCDDFVASGAEDKHGYLWDRHYGICLTRFPHNDVVNSVAFNPVDSEMLVTASDDHTVKIWRSRNRVNQIKRLVTV